MPCVDKEPDTCSSSIVCDQQNNDAHHSDFDLCSPFCTCHCCSTSLTIVFKGNLLPATMSPTTLDFFYKAKRFSEIDFSFWQPPKI